MDITGPESLELRRAQLLAERAQQEAALKLKSREMVTALNPLNIVKESIHDLAGDKDVRFDVAKVGLSVGANFVIGQLLGQPKTSKGALRAILVQTIATTLINSNATRIITEMAGVLHTIEKKVESKDFNS